MTTSSTTVGWRARIMERVSAHEDQHAAVDVRTAFLRPKQPIENGSEALCLARPFHTQQTGQWTTWRAANPWLSSGCTTRNTCGLWSKRRTRATTTRNANLELSPTDERECHALFTSPATTLPRSPDVRVVSRRWSCISPPHHKK